MNRKIVGIVVSMGIVLAASAGAARAQGKPSFPLFPDTMDAADTVSAHFLEWLNSFSVCQSIASCAKHARL
jgi:hypothetical protein